MVLRVLNPEDRDRFFSGVHDFAALCGVLIFHRVEGPRSPLRI